MPFVEFGRIKDLIRRGARVNGFFEFGREKAPGASIVSPAHRMRIIRSIQFSQAILKKSSQEFAVRLGKAGDVGVEPLEQQRATAGSRLSSPKAAHFGFLEDVVSSEQFISAFTGEYNFEPSIA